MLYNSTENTTPKSNVRYIKVQVNFKQIEKEDYYRKLNEEMEND